MNVFQLSIEGFNDFSLKTVISFSFSKPGSRRRRPNSECKKEGSNEHLHKLPDAIASVVLRSCPCVVFVNYILQDKIIMLRDNVVRKIDVNPPFSAVLLDHPSCSPCHGCMMFLLLLCSKQSLKPIIMHSTGPHILCRL